MLPRRMTEFLIFWRGMIFMNRQLVNNSRRRCEQPWQQVALPIVSLEECPQACVLVECSVVS